MNTCGSASEAGADGAAAAPGGFTRDSVPRVGHGFRLQWESVQNAYVLLYPEGMVKLNASAGEILACCDGTSSVAAIVATLEQRFEQSALEPEVIAFLNLASAQRWVAPA